MGCHRRPATPLNAGLSTSGNLEVEATARTILWEPELSKSVRWLWSFGVLKSFAGIPVSSDTEGGSDASVKVQDVPSPWPFLPTTFLNAGLLVHGGLDEDNMNLVVLLRLILSKSDMWLWSYSVARVKSFPAASNTMRLAFTKGQGYPRRPISTPQRHLLERRGTGRGCHGSCDSPCPKII
jgi:hypothetical protein